MNEREEERPLVAVIMGSKSDWETMRHAAGILADFGVRHECRIVSAHRTPAWMTEFSAKAEASGLEVIIAGAGGAAHLPGTIVLALHLRGSIADEDLPWLSKMRPIILIRHAIAAMTTRISSIARSAPRQRLVPPPNGTHV